jgi:hypothetical protein
MRRKKRDVRHIKKENKRSLSITDTIIIIIIIIIKIARCLLNYEANALNRTNMLHLKNSDVQCKKKYRPELKFPEHKVFKTTLVLCCEASKNES